MIKILTDAGAEFDSMKVTPEVFATEASEYIKERSTPDGYVVLPGNLLVKGIMAGVRNLGCFAYRYEDGKIVCYKMVGDASIEQPSIFDGQSKALESFPVINGAGQYRDKMVKVLDDANGTIRTSGNELDIPDAVSDILSAKKEEVVQFIAGLSAFPQTEQERMCREKIAEVDQLARVTMLTVFMQANSGSFWVGRWSDDVDSATVDEDIKKYARLGYSFNNTEPLSEYWKSIDEPCQKVFDYVAGKEYADEYTNYFTQAVSLALMEATVMKHDPSKGGVYVQSWKSLDQEELELDIRDVLMYEEWVLAYKGAGDGKTSPEFKLEFQRKVVEHASAD